ncbi:unnamed protein product [Fraxinus pennsylvanica]|uniref:RAE1/2 domain-containing protein n=1 Tax=Fraxinus pennsylvanica TaxID=56036 RepID=A0AAD2DL55_9LAMI|nr:unnamed protein product [Fraxinus pennsylvanica]
MLTRVGRKRGETKVLRMPVMALLMDKDSGAYKGVKLASGQELFSAQLILAPSFTITSSLAPFSSHKLSSHDLALQDVKEKVARGICITRNSLKPDIANCLVIFPPGSLCSDQRMSVRVFQLSSNVAVCPSGMFVTYLSAPCDNAVEGKKLLHSAINALFSVSISGKSEKSNKGDHSENTEVKPSLLWSALYLQELTKGAFESINYMTMPDEHLHYNSLLDTTAKLFQKMFPGEEFFPTTNPSDEFADDAEEQCYECSSITVKDELACLHRLAVVGKSNVNFEDAGHSRAGLRGRPEGGRVEVDWRSSGGKGLGLRPEGGGVDCGLWRRRSGGNGARRGK